MTIPEKERGAETEKSQLKVWQQAEPTNSFSAQKAKCPMLKPTAKGKGSCCPYTKEVYGMQRKPNACEILFKITHT